MTFQQLASIDLNALSKQQLRSYTKLAREEWGRSIDLRSSNIHDLREYLTMYLSWKATAESEATEPEVEAVAPEVEVAISNIEENATVSQAPALEPEDFEITICDRCEKRCELAPELPEPALKVPETFNNITARTVDILLQFGTAYGNLVDKDWIAGILQDCRWRSTIPNQLREKLILSDPIYYGLAGIAHDSIALYQRVVRSPEEFGNIPEKANPGADFYRNIGSLIGADKIAQISVYHTIRNNLNYLQERLGISSLEPRTAAIRDKLFENRDYNDQMIILPSDRRTLKAETPRIAAYFQALTTDYKLYCELDDESLEPLPEGFDLQVMLGQSFGCDYAWIRAESYTWQPTSDGGFIGHHIQQLDPDKITLSLNAWDGDDYASFLRIVAHHRDGSRFPWLASTSS